MACCHLHNYHDAMYDLSGFPLQALLNISKESELVTSYRTTDWVVVPTVDGRELVMNHDNARIFLQGLILGASLRSRDRASVARIGDGWTRSVPADRIVIG